MNGSTSTPPPIAVNDVSPTGWNTFMPTVGALQYLWWTMAKKTASGELLSIWSMPQRQTPIDGQDGAIGPSPIYRDVYSSTKTYYGTTSRVDVVKYGSTYYVARTDAGEFVGVLPTNSTKWNTFGGQFESIATELLLAENANLAGWVFRNNKLYSQNGENYLDGVTGDAKLSGVFRFGTSYNGNYSNSSIFYVPRFNTAKSITLGQEEDDIGKIVTLYNTNPLKGAYLSVYNKTFGIDSNGGSNSTIAPTIETEIPPQGCATFVCLEVPPSEIVGSYTKIGRWRCSSMFVNTDAVQNATTKIIYHPGGMIEQWGGASFNGFTGHVDFPVEYFTANTLSVIINLVFKAGSKIVGCYVSSYDKTGFDIGAFQMPFIEGNTTFDIQWRAIGY